VLAASVALAGCSKGTVDAPVTTPTAAKPSASASATVSAKAYQFIQILNTGYKPASVTVKVGTKVTWTNKTTKSHGITFDAGPKSGAIASEKSAGHIFTAPGTFTYHDDANAGMTGTIIVK
jgi:plastocyanin